MSILDKKYLSLRITRSGVEMLCHGPVPAELKEYSFEDITQAALPATVVQAGRQHYESVTCSLDHEFFSWVPAGIFDPEHAREYMALSMPSMQDDYRVLYDEVPLTDMMLVYAVKKSVYDAVISVFPSVVFRHFAGVWLRYLLRKPSSEKYVAGVHLGDEAFYLSLFHNGKIILCNRYSIRAPEDVLYFILFAMEQWKIPPAETSLVLSGNLHENTNTVVLLREFFQHIEADETPSDISGNGKFEGALLNQYLCAL